jgi:tetratricopeptide (TPR) repeat protein
MMISLNLLSAAEQRRREAWEFFRNGEYEAAERNYRLALAMQQGLIGLNPEEPSLLHRLVDIQLSLGEVLEHSNRLGAAEKIYMQSLTASTSLAEAFPKDIKARSTPFPAFRVLISAFMKTSQFDRAEEFAYRHREACERVIKDFELPGSTDLILCNWQLADVMRQTGRLQEAERTCRLTLAQLKSAETLDSSAAANIASTQWRLAKVLAAEGKVKESHEAFLAVLRHYDRRRYSHFHYSLHDDLERSRIHRDLGDLFRQAERADEAMKAYRDCLILLENLELNNPSRGDCLFQLAQFLVTCPDRSLRDPDRAITLAEKALVSNFDSAWGERPSIARCWRILGVARYQTRDFKGAVKALEKSVQLTCGGDAYTWFPLALAHWKLGSKMDAERFVDDAFEWSRRHQPHDEELASYRAEAEQLIGVPIGFGQFAELLPLPAEMPD